MIFARTDRLTLRALEESELPRLTELLGIWDIVRWLTVVPFPYTLRDAETFYADIKPSYEKGAPEFYALALQTDNLLIGGVGLHAPRTPNPLEGESEIGYWLGRDFWGQGLTSEAARAVVNAGFARKGVRAIGATTAPANHASKNVLRKIGLRDMGVMPRPYAALRGGGEVVKWLLTREEWERNKS